MNILFVILLIAGIVGAVVFKKKNMKFPMIGCIIVAIVAAFLLICAAWLFWAID